MSEQANETDAERIERIAADFEQIKAKMRDDNAFDRECALGAAYALMIFDLPWLLSRVEAQRWIPVTEKLPENSRCTCWVFVNDTGDKWTTTAGFQRFEEGYGFYSSGVCIPVTHWMPLPGPPIAAEQQQGEEKR